MVSTYKSMADDVADYFATNSLGRRGTTIYVNKAPENKNNFILITDTGGAAPEQYYPLDHPSVQVAVYGEENKHAATMELAMSAFHLLNRKQNFMIGTRDALYARAVASPQVIGLDPAKKRWLITFNVMFKIRGVDGQ